jgi:hypothetical protein
VGTVVVIALIVAAAGFVQAAAGFGFALLAVPLLALVVPPETAVVITFLHGTCSSLLTAGRHHGHIDRTETRRLSTGAVLGMPLGALVLVSASPEALRIAVGVATCAAATWMLLPHTRTGGAREVRPAATYAVGALSGVLNTAVATNGPPLVVYLRARGLATDTFRATISAVFTISNVVGLGILLVAGAVHAPAVAAFVLTLVPALVGWFAGNHAAGRLRSEHFVRVVDVILLVSGLLAIGRAVL